MTVQYRSILADPPWEYAGGVNGSDPTSGRGLPPEKRKPSLHLGLPYAAMSVDEIAALPVQSLGHESARLFLWATNRHLPTALGIVMPSWGFEYRQTLVWVKTGNPNPLGGSVAPNHAEFLLVGVRGTPWLDARWNSSVIPAPRQTHSRKPDVFRDLIEKVSPGPYLELFARSQRLNWDTWGFEALEHVNILGDEGLPPLALGDVVDIGPEGPVFYEPGMDEFVPEPGNSGV